MNSIVDAMHELLKNASCAICAKEFKDWNLYKDHMQSAHEKDLMKVGNSDDEPPAAVKNILETAVQNGLLSSSMAQKLSTKEGYPKPVQIRYIMPGLVEYEYMNGGEGARVLVTKNALDKMLADPEKSIVGKPVINEAHREVSPDDYKNGVADGIVTRAWYEPTDGWYYCEALIWDDETRNNIQNGYSVSCEYTALPPWGPAGQLNQVSYDKEVTDGRYKHLAVVSGPRYEGAKIMNSTGGTKTMKLLQWLKKDGKDVENAVEVDPAKIIFTGEGGKEYSIENAVAVLEAQEALKAKTIGDNDTIIVNGKTYKGADLKNAIAAQIKNASDDKDDKDKKEKKDLDNADDDDNDKDKKEKKDMDNAEDDDEDKKKKKDEDAKNALLMNSQHRLGQHVQPNEKCAICDGIQSERLANAARMREGKLPTPVVPSVMDGLRRGRELMGVTRAQQEAAANGSK
jgi:hypothetical protein